MWGGPDYEQELLLPSVQRLQLLLCISAMIVSFRSVARGHALSDGLPAESGQSSGRGVAAQLYDTASGVKESRGGGGGG